MKYACLIIYLTMSFYSYTGFTNAQAGLPFIKNLLSNDSMGTIFSIFLALNKHKIVL